MHTSKIRFFTARRILSGHDDHQHNKYQRKKNVNKETRQYEEEDENGFSLQAHRLGSFDIFFVIAIAAPLLDSQTCLPPHFYPPVLIDLKHWYTNEYGDYLVADKPHFFVGIVWLELLFQWPLSLLNIYGILGSKNWFQTTCLMYGASVLTSMVAILAEMIGSGKASDKLLMMYYPFVGLGILAILRGMLPESSKTSSSHAKRPALRKKRA